MKILVIGSDKIFAIENFYVKSLRQLGVEVYQFPAQSFFYDYYQKDFINKLIFKTGFSTIYKVINKRLKRAVNEFNPDILWVFKGMEIFPATLIWAKNLGIILVSFNPDNPFLFSGKGSGNKNVTDSIGLYHLHFTYNLEIKTRLENEFMARTAWLPFGYNIEDEVFTVAIQQNETCELCFLGNPDKERSMFILALANKGIQISVYGHNWNRFLAHSNIAIHSPVYGVEQWKVLRRYRAQLNLMRPHNERSHNMRTFEVPGIGGIMVAPDTIEHRMFFETDQEVFLFRDVEECVTKVKWLLQLSKQEADEIRKRARERSLRSGYSYQVRSQQVVTELNNLMGR